MSPIDGTYKHVEWAVSVRPAFTATSLCPSSSSSLSSSGSATINPPGNLTGEKPPPEVLDRGRRELLAHGLDDLGCRDRLGAWEALQKRCKAEEMIAVPVGDIDRGEVLAARDDPIQQSLRLLGREKGVHENGVAFTVDECRRIRHPHQLFLAGWQIAAEARTLYRKYIPLKSSVSTVGCPHRQLFCWL